MRNRNNHSVTFKKKLVKSKKLFRAFSELQCKFGEMLDQDKDILEINSNVLLSEFELGDSYTTDFVCIKKDGSTMVRECVYRKTLNKPLTVKLLDASRNYWLNKGIQDWGIVLDVEQNI